MSASDTRFAIKVVSDAVANFEPMVCKAAVSTLALDLKPMPPCEKGVTL